MCYVCVSPAIIVPRMIKIINEDYKKAPPQTILAGASLDDIFVIILFTILLSFLQGEKVSLKYFMLMPIYIVLEISLGILIAKFLYKVIKNIPVEIQFILILSSSIMLVYIGEVLPISGLIGIIVMSMYF